MHKSHYENVPFELPESWVWARIIDICEEQETKRPTGDTFRYIDIDAIDNKLHSVSAPKVTQTSQAPSRAAKGVRSGDILFSTVRPYLENIAFVTEDLDDCIASTGFYVCRPRPKIIFPRYLYYFLISSHAINGINSYMRGDNSPSIRKDEMDSFLVPIPPISEQERIAKLLDSTLVVVDDVERQKNILSDAVTAAKSKILSLAIRGKLVAQDPNDEPASALLERIRTERENLIKVGKIKRDKSDSVILRGDDNSYYDELPQSWELATLGTLSTTIQYGLSNAAEEAGSHRLLRITDIQDNRVVWSDVPFTTITDRQAEEFSLKLNDIVFARTGATVGKSYLISELVEPSVFASYLIRVQVIGVFPKFVKRFFECSFYWTQIVDKSVGIGQPNVNGTKLRDLILPIPPLAEQRRIVAAIESAFAELDNIATQLI
ncbi:restriction endonuclease subunit S [Dehalobacter restrictus]|uniref:restriction endonuclease subunit S n=1 Tax=Dehalobacter restrictus TaxID=55583 RepID=UPI00339053F3